MTAPTPTACSPQRIGAPYALVLSGVTRAEDLPVSPAPALVEPIWRRW